MRRSWLFRLLAIAAILSVQVAFVASSWAEPASFNDPNMQTLWERTDKPVEMFVVSRSYMWGPNTLPGSPSVEPYLDSPGGHRTVQYFDKSRMEVNNPNGDRSNLFFITNGLLVREMVSGQLQLGNNTFQSRVPSSEAVAGDPAPVNPDSPTYASFQGVASTNNNNPSPDRTGQPVNQAIDKAGNVTTIASPDPSVVYVNFSPNLQHNIPNKFFDFLNQTGPIFVNGRIVQNQPVINPIFLAGYPISEAYWVKANVAGVERDVLVQLYERRVLTYTPSDPAGFQVEMGNVGQHYFRWRYQTPSADADTDAAVQTILNYYGAINDRRFQEAYELWGGNGAASNQTLAEFTQGFGSTVQVTVQLGMPTEQASLSASSVTVPITIASVVNQATQQVVQRFQGTYTLQPGASASPRATGWVITGASIAQAPSTTALPPDLADPVSVLNAYFTAINQRQFARAYTYWDNLGLASGQSFAAFHAGFAATVVDVVTLGTPQENGAAGSIFANVPVTIAAVQTDGTTKQFSGMYTLRRSNVPPFDQLGWRIVSAAVTPQ